MYDIDFTSDFFKLKSIKTYCNADWLYENTKQYRTVFDEEELAYVYCEFAIYNKKFDDADWEIKLDLICYDDNNNLICNLNCDRTIEKKDAIGYIREGWGVSVKGTYWRKGEYRWEARTEGELIALKPFYVENQNFFSKSVNPYFSIICASLYEGPDENVSYNKRYFTKTFDHMKVRYVWLELEILNKVKSTIPWNAELLFYYKTSTGLLKGFDSKLFKIDNEIENFYIDCGWGSDQLGTWAVGYYTIDVVFMNTIIATIPFEIYDKKTIKNTLLNLFRLRNTIKI